MDRHFPMFKCSCLPVIDHDESTFAPTWSTLREPNKATKKSTMFKGESTINIYTEPFWPFSICVVYCGIRKVELPAGYLFHVLFPFPTALKRGHSAAPFRRPTRAIRGRPGCFRDPEPSRRDKDPNESGFGEGEERSCQAHLWVDDVFLTKKTNMSSFKCL